jgi:hypothetical protein
MEIRGIAFGKRARENFTRGMARDIFPGAELMRLTSRRRLAT